MCKLSDSRSRRSPLKEENNLLLKGFSLSSNDGLPIVVKERNENEMDLVMREYSDLEHLILLISYILIKMKNIMFDLNSTYS